MPSLIGHVRVPKPWLDAKPFFFFFCLRENRKSSKASQSPSFYISGLTKFQEHSTFSINDGKKGEAKNGNHCQTCLTDTNYLQIMTNKAIN